MIHLRGASADVVLDESSGVPIIVHWGAPLGDVDLTTIDAALERPITHGALDVVAPISIVPEHGSGFQGHPGVAMHRRRGRHWAPRFAPHGVRSVSFGADAPGGVAEAVVVSAVDEVARVRLDVTVSLGAVLAIWATLTNSGDDLLLLDELSLAIPLPAHASELTTFTGRWTRELNARRRPWETGAVVSENRRGRTSHEHVPLVFATSAHAGEWSGEVWGAHLAWSGNHRVLAECLPDGRRYLQFGELFHPGEIALAGGQQYATPPVLAVYSSDGMTPATWGFHRWLRSRPTHPKRPRPVLLNTWEAVYFDHDADRLRQLADAAAAVGVERYVLDDGWFGGRRDDRRGLGDWTVSVDAHPDGLGPLIEHVRRLGMEFGIWVEPEMVNVDSDVYRAHPEWVLATDGYVAVEGRHQLVLDLAQTPCFDYVLERLDVLLSDHDIAFVKWDMNRDHVHASGSNGAAGSHAQTLAVYALLDELRVRHPDVEFESCASGGGRIDHAILQRTDRVWTSDCNDPLERQIIQRGASMFVPPELMGAHIGPPRSHTTGRTHSLAFRGLTALFGHLGVEWDVSRLDERERRDLTAVIALHRRCRDLLHRGDVVRFDVPPDGPVEAGPVALAHGVYAADRGEAMVAFVQLRTGPTLTPSPLRLPGLDAAGSYEVRELVLPGTGRSPARHQPAWLANGIVITGRQLATHGLQMPALHPESGVLLHLVRRDSRSN